MKHSTLLAAATLGLTVGCSPQSNQYEPPPPPTVVTAKPVQQDVTLFIEQNGRTEAVQEAEVRSRVRGFVEEIVFQPGDKVEPGQELYRIERDFYEASRDSAQAAVAAADAAINVAEAALETAQAATEKARSDFQREKRLLESGAGAQSDYDAAKAALESAAAQLTSAKAQIDAETAKKSQAEAALTRAELDLEYTQVRAPIAGRVTKTLVKLGNLVEDGSALTTVIDRSKIYANFSISDRELLDLIQAEEVSSERKNDPEYWASFAVYVQPDPRGTQWVQGHLEYVDQAGIEAETGTFGLRAVFENDERQLLPGLFVRVRLPIRKLPSTVLVPQRAIVATPSGQFVLVVDDQNVVQRRAVTVGQVLDRWAVIRDGLSADESFILEGLQKARPGDPVAPSSTTLSTEASPMLQASLKFSDD